MPKTLLVLLSVAIAICSLQLKSEELTWSVVELYAHHWINDSKMQSTKETKIKEECNQAACIQLKKNINESRIMPHATKKKKKKEKEKYTKVKINCISKTETQTETDRDREREWERLRESDKAFNMIMLMKAHPLSFFVTQLELHSGNNNTWHRNPATDSRRCSC